jgi:hypothetical protein
MEACLKLLSFPWKGSLLHALGRQIRQKRGKHTLRSHCTHTSPRQTAHRSKETSPHLNPPRPCRVCSSKPPPPSSTTLLRLSSPPQLLQRTASSAALLSLSSPPAPAPRAPPQLVDRFLTDAARFSLGASTSIPRCGPVCPAGSIHPKAPPSCSRRLVQSISGTVRSPASSA